ncbi:MAG: hypothetical protein KAS04_04050 [Candidatus Aenigmarchaeota archaeon]|nr:hypothetical protein [Candidatus Aenigmarchaeota archaeon]
MKKYVFYLRIRMATFTGCGRLSWKKISAYGYSYSDARCQALYKIPEKMFGTPLIRKATKETLYDRPWMT